MNPFLSTYSEQTVVEEKATKKITSGEAQFAANDDKYHKGYFCADKDSAANE